MTTNTPRSRSVELLQQLGLKEYEARCFVALSRLPHGTAKRISEISEVPRTRVYDAIRVLESNGLVEVQHTSPKRFRAVSLEEAVDTLRREFETKTDDLARELERLEPVTPDEDGEESAEVWSLAGRQAIESRSRQLLGEADDEVVLVVDDEASLTDELQETLKECEEAGVDVTVSVLSGDPPEDVPGDACGTGRADTLVDPLAESVGGLRIHRVLLVDGSSALVSSAPSDGAGEEQCVVGIGAENSVVTLLRQLLGCETEASG